MRLESGLYASRESLITHGTAMSNLADNLANLNTPGFKTSRVEFSDILAQSQGSLYSPPSVTGSGVQASSVAVNHSQQGSLNLTGRELDFAIEGRGYFITNDGTNTVYTRGGAFGTDNAGNIVSAKGGSLMGFTEASPATLVPLNIGDVAGQAQATSEIALRGNLNTGLPVVEPIANPASFKELGDSSQFNTSITAIDSLGASHDIVLHFFHTDTLTWTVNAYVNGLETGGEDGVPVQVGTSQIAITDTGVQAEGAAPLAITANWANGAAGSTIAGDLSGFTGFASASNVSSIVSNGVTAGIVEGFELLSNGDLVARLSSGSTTLIGSVVVANFNNPNGLIRVGNSGYVETPESGEASIGIAGSEGRGVTRSGALENSTADTASEFIDMVRFQRGYQAGSQVITTLSDMMRDTIQLA
jgi:flagellar hook protein FlgE